MESIPMWTLVEIPSGGLNPSPIHIGSLQSISCATLPYRSLEDLDCGIFVK